MTRITSKDDHIAALIAAHAAIRRVIRDYRAEETGYARYRADLDEALSMAEKLSDPTLSDPTPEDLGFAAI